MYTKPTIQAIGTAVPSHKISQEEHYSILESANGLSREEKLQLRKVYSRSGISSRHSVLSEFGHNDHQDNLVFHPSDSALKTSISVRMDLFQQFSGALLNEAIRNCFNEIPSLQKSEITHLITFSCTGMSAPGLDIEIINSLGLNKNIERTCINFMGCYAGINALKFARHISRSQPDSIILLAGVELCTLHYQKNERSDQVIANALFGDGAAACIVAQKKIESGVDNFGLGLNNFYSEFESAGNEEMVWSIGDFGFNLKLSAYVPELIEKHIYSLTEKLFVQAGLKKEDIDFFAIHPGGMKILEACEKALSISKEQNTFSYETLANYGNMSSVTIFFVLKKYLNSFKEEDRSKKMLACAFGPGLTMESMIAEVY